MSVSASFFLSSFLLLFSTAIAHESATAYDLLADYNFPKGLLPKGVVGYELDQSTGKFSAFLNGSCSFSLEGNYQLDYKSTISGFISKDRLTNLHGVRVKVLLFWFNIVEVIRYGDEIELSVGIASASFPFENFVVCPRCGCGLDCDDDDDDFRSPVRKLKLNPSTFASSV